MCSGGPTTTGGCPGTGTARWCTSPDSPNPRTCTASSRGTSAVRDRSHRRTPRSPAPATPPPTQWGPPACASTPGLGDIAGHGPGDRQRGREPRTFRSSLAGQSIVVDVFPETVGPNAFLEMRVELSDQPLSGGRSAGTYSIAYRIGGPDAPGTRRISGRDGFIGLSAPSGASSTVTLTPGSDMALLWPDLIAGDSWMPVESRSRRGARRRRHRWPTSTTSDSSERPATNRWSTSGRVMQALAVRYPDIQQHQGLEVSFYDHHINWFGSGFSLPNYGEPALEAVGRRRRRGARARRAHPSGRGPVEPEPSIRLGRRRAEEPVGAGLHQAGSRHQAHRQSRVRGRYS